MGSSPLRHLFSSANGPAWSVATIATGCHAFCCHSRSCVKGEKAVVVLSSAIILGVSVVAPVVQVRAVEKQRESVGNDLAVFRLEDPDPVRLSRLVRFEGGQVRYLGTLVVLRRITASQRSFASFGSSPSPNVAGSWSDYLWPLQGVAPLRRRPYGPAIVCIGVCVAGDVAAAADPRLA